MDINSAPVIVPRPAPGSRAVTGPAKPRVAFFGTGWIGQSRLRSVVEADTADIVAIADTDPDCLANAAEIVPSCERLTTLEQILALKPDGVVIATPSAMHCDQTIQALENGTAVFCQKPMGLNERETRAAIDAARRADRLLSVDFSYRQTSGLKSIRKIIESGELGRIFSAELAFHNAYGPDKQWYFQRELAGGGCMTDLGVHLIDAALWCLDAPEVKAVSGQLYRQGVAIAGGADESEDFATAEMLVGDNVNVRIACSWNAHAGQDAQISARFWGTRGAVQWENVGGSFYNFALSHCEQTRRLLLSAPEEQWGGGAINAWVRQLQADKCFDPEIEEAVMVSLVLDRIYRRPVTASKIY